MPQITPLKITMPFKIPGIVKQALYLQAEREGVSYSEYIRQAFREYCYENQEKLQNSYKIKEKKENNGKS